MIQRSTKALLFLALGAVAFAAQDGVSLKRDLKPSKTSYSNVVKTSQIVVLPNGMGEQEMIFNMTYDNTTEIKDVDGEGWATVEDTVSDFKMTADGPMAGMMGDAPTPATYKTIYKLNAFGKTKDMKVEGLSAEQQAMVNSMNSSMTGAFQFPEGPVKIGESFKMPVPKSPMFGDKEQSINVTLVGEKEVNGRMAWVLKAAGPLEMSGDLGAMMGGGAPDGMKMVMKGTMDMDTETLVEKGSGIILGSKTTAKSKMKLELPDMGMSLDLTGTTSSETKLKG